MVTPMKRGIIIGFLALTFSLPAVGQDMMNSDLQSIFSGKDLSGWLVPEDNIWWRASDGILIVKSGPNQTGSTLWSEEEYRNFVMQFEFKMGEGTVDSGIFLRTESQQIQIGISGSLKRDMTGSPYISGEGYPVEATGVAELLKQSDWNHMTIIAIGNTYSVWLNGKHVMVYSSATAVEQGPVGIQLHGNRDMGIEYRDLRLARLQ